jgi:hypothetical protein
MGDKSGGVARITPVRPRALSRANAGSSPRATIRSIVSQSAPSIPTNTIGRGCAAVPAGCARACPEAAAATAATRTRKRRETRPVVRRSGPPLASLTGVDDHCPLRSK